MKDRYFKIILKYVNKLAPNLRKPKYSSEYYLTNILNLLNDFNSWESLKKSTDINHSKPYHFKTIADVHRLWCQKGVYRKAFEEIRKENIDIDEESIYDLLIDSTLIINKYGSENVGYGSETRKKKFSKITMITNNNNDIINVIENKSSTKEIILGAKKIKRKRGRPKKIPDNQINDIPIKENNGKKIIIKTLEHDVKGIIPVLDNCGIQEYKMKNVIGDTGYLLNDDSKEVLSKKNIRLITPYRRNQKKQNTEADKKKLKGRSAIERKFSSVKRHNRIHVRKDRFIINFMGFFYLGIINIS